MDLLSEARLKELAEGGQGSGRKSGSKNKAGTHSNKYLNPTPAQDKSNRDYIDKNWKKKGLIPGQDFPEDWVANDDEYVKQEAIIGETDGIRGPNHRTQYRSAFE